MDLTNLKNKIIDHYVDNWQNQPEVKTWPSGPMEDLDDNFSVLEFSPSNDREMWTYATCGMSNFEEENPLELHLFSNKKDESIVELLTMIAYYHRTGSNLGLEHTVNFGRSWQDDSSCSFGLVSLPYLDGPKLENLYMPEYDENLKFLWLIPLTEDEVNYKKEYGMEALEEKLEQQQFNYLDSNRKSVLNKKRRFFT